VKAEIVIKDEWYQKLIFDLKKLAFEKIIEIKHSIGKRILKDISRFGKPKYGNKTIKNLAEDLDCSQADLYACMKFAEKYPELSNDIRKFSWFYIYNHLLYEHKEKSKENEWLRIYNIWNLGKLESEEDFFGIFPSVFMENLLHYHTEKNDLIYDPFAGSGTTIDVCRKTNRRFYCSDLVVHPGRKDIEKWNVQNGLPKDLKKPDLVFLDPPYWIQAKDKYSKSSDDLANMPLDEFYNIFNNFLKLLINWKVKKIAIVIAPTQYSNINHEFEDHIFKFHEILSANYRIEMRYILPYSTEQYNGTQVEIMKKEKKAINLIRDLVIWDLKID